MQGSNYNTRSSRTREGKPKGPGVDKPRRVAAGNGEQEIFQSRVSIGSANDSYCRTKNDKRRTGGGRPTKNSGEAVHGAYSSVPDRGHCGPGRRVSSHNALRIGEIWIDLSRGGFGN